MKDRIMNTKIYPRPSTKAERMLYASGLWLRIGFVGASALAVGVLQLFGGEVNPRSALMLGIGGGVLAVISWWRARAVLEIGDAASAAASRASLRGSARAAAAR
jgi:hypothetical protein